jgi:two-component system, NtrC family, response regulator AtoC
MTKVLVVEDDAVARDLLREILNAEGFEVEAVDDGAPAVERAGKQRYDLVVSDIRMERVTGMEVLRAFSEKSPGTPVILITAFGDVTGAMEAIGRGAYDYVSKPFNIEELRQTVARALERKRLSAEADAGTRSGQERTPVADIEGKSPRMLEVYKLVARVAPTTATVLVVGESGTGKELVARAIHSRSPRASKPFVPVNCTALSESLLESELFGHARGAFTGAVGAKRGLFEMANGGTLFLDEIGDMGPKDAGPTAARPAGRRAAPGGRDRIHQGRRSPGVRHQSRPGSGREGGPFPRGSLFPHQRGHRAHAFPA